MKQLIIIILIIVCGLTSTINADVRVRGHYRSNPDGNFWNNWSTYPNVNPYTGVRGTKRTPPCSQNIRYVYTRNSGGYARGTGHRGSVVSFSQPGRERRIAQQAEKAQRKARTNANMAWVVKRMKIKAEIKVIALRIAKMKIKYGNSSQVNIIEKKRGNKMTEQSTLTEDQPSEPDKVKPLAQYLAKYLATGIDRTHEAGMPMDYTEEGLKPVLEQALDTYQSTEGVVIQIIKRK